MELQSGARTPHNPPTLPDDLREVKTVAEELGVKRGTLSYWIYQGFIRQYERGGRVYCSLREARAVYQEKREAWRESRFPESRFPESRFPAE